MAYQLDRPSDGTGIVVAFRRKESPDSTYTVQLRGLDPDATYRLSFDPDVAAPGRKEIRLGHKPDPALLISDDGDWTQPSGPSFGMTGRELSEGLTLTLPDRRSSLLLRYSKRL